MWRDYGLSQSAEQIQTICLLCKRVREPFFRVAQWQEIGEKHLPASCKSPCRHLIQKIVPLLNPLRAIATERKPTTEVATVTTGRRRLTAITATTLTT